MSCLCLMLYTILNIVTYYILILEMTTERKSELELTTSTTATYRVDASAAARVGGECDWERGRAGSSATGNERAS